LINLEKLPTAQFSTYIFVVITTVREIIPKQIKEIR